MSESTWKSDAELAKDREDEAERSRQDAKAPVRTPKKPDKGGA